MGKNHSKSKRLKTESSIAKIQDQDGVKFRLFGPSEKIDFLQEFENRNCHHIVERILFHLDELVLAGAINVSTTWNHLVESYISQVFSKDQQYCLRWLGSLSLQSFRSEPSIT